MKVTGELSQLSGAVAFAARYAARAGSSLPALAGVRLDAEPDRLRLHAYDHEAAGSAEVPTIADEPGSVLVPGRVLAEILQTFPGGEVVLHDHCGALELVGGDETTGEIRFTLPTLPLEDQPAPPAPPPPCGTVSTDAFARAVRRAGRVATRDDLVPVLTGTLLRMSRDQLTVAAADRYRVGSCSMPWIDPPEIEHDVVAPARLLADTAAGIDAASTLELSVRANDPTSILGIRSVTGEQVRSAVLRPLDGQFPPLRPRTAATETDHLGALTVDTEQLRAALGRVCLVADRQTAAVLRVEAGRLTVSASGTSSGTGQQTMPADVVGEGTTVAYNASYLRDGLDFVAGDRVRLLFNEGTRTASLLTSVEDPTYRYVVMPRRLPENQTSTGAT